MQYDRAMAERLWVLVVGGLTALVTIGAVLFPQRVYDQFLWRYFWGPVAADGRGVSCIARQDGQTIVPEQCTTASGIVAEPGYTVVSTVSYGVLLVLLLFGVYLLLLRLDLGSSPTLIYGLFPFVLLGGTLRTIEDASTALLEATGSPALPFPYSAIIISPFIYGTMFVLTLGALGASLYLADRDIVARYETALGAIGIALLTIAIAYLGYLTVTTARLTVTPAIPVITFGGAALGAGLLWILTERYIPVVNDGTGRVGVLIIWGHLVDGIANVVNLDWAAAFGLPEYGPKHVVNAAVRSLTEAIQPAWLSDAIGITWPFIILKAAAALLIVYLFNEEIYDQAPQYTVLMLLIVLAVGLGPGTRNVIRATLGI